MDFPHVLGDLVMFSCIGWGIGWTDHNIHKILGGPEKCECCPTMKWEHTWLFLNTFDSPIPLAACPGYLGTWVCSQRGHQFYLQMILTPANLVFCWFWLLLILLFAYPNSCQCCLPMILTPTKLLYCWLWLLPISFFIYYDSCQFCLPTILTLPNSVSQ